MAAKRGKKNKPIVRPGAKPNSSSAPAPGILFTEFTLDRLKKIITNATIEQYDINRKFYEGDHWQDEAGWVGPQPEEGSEERGFVMDEIERAFLSKNVIKEIVGRHANGVIGRAPVWQFVPLAPKPASDKRNTTAEDTAVAELELAVTRWWNKRNVHERIKDAVAQMLFGARSPFRLYVPPDRITSAADGATEGVLRADTLEAALDNIFPHVPNIEEAALYTDPLTQHRLGIYITKPVDPLTGNPGSDEVTELTYLLNDQLDTEGKPLTAIEIKSKEPSLTPIQLAGNLTMYEIARPLLITEQLQQQQRALNLALSMLPRNVVTGGFLERVLLNAQLPGEWEKDKDGNNIRFIPSRYITGAGTTNALVGVEDEQPDGKMTRSNPDVKWREPSPVKPTIDAAQALYLAMLEEGKQAHIILSGEALVSGISREQARSDYDLSLTDSKAPTEMLGEWVLMIAVSLAEFFMGQPGLYTSKYRPVFQCHTFTGPVTWEERKQNDASIGKSLSQQRAMEMNGVVDVDAVMSQMRNEELTIAMLAEAQGKALKALVDAGIPAEVAAELLGFDATVISAIKLLATQALEAEEELRKEEVAAQPVAKAPV